MAVVTFQRATDAVLARSKYDGKVIDGSKFLLFTKRVYTGNRPTEKLEHKLKIELVTEADEPLPKAVKEQQPSLLSRISGPHTRPESVPTSSVVLPTPPP